MQEEVLLTVKGIQMDLGEEGMTELTTAARYFNRNGKHYIIYEEPEEDGAGVRNNTIKIADGHVEVIRKGNSHVHMVFSRGKQHKTFYQTAVGPMLMDTFTSDVIVREEEKALEANVFYDLSMNETFISKCRVILQIKERGTK